MAAPSERLATLALAAVLATTLAGGCATAPEQAPPFGVHRLTLYDCGLAQVEREARVDGASELAVALKQAHLDDLLATLVVAAEGSVKVSGVRFPSVFNLGQARAASSFANAAGDSESLGKEASSEVCRYILALVGTGVAVETVSGRHLTGTVLDCAAGPGPAATVAPDDEEQDEARGGVEHLVLVGPHGEISWVSLAGVLQVSPLSEREGEAMHTYARQLGRAPGLDATTVRIQTAAGSHGRLAAGYVQQAPVWRMSYKIRTTPDGVSLEAWGLVHNDTEEEWREVGLTLVSGLPESYVMSMASPRYREREALYLDQGNNMYPQLGAATPDSLLYEESVVRYEYGGSGAGFGARGSAGIGYASYGASGGTSAVRAARGQAGEGESSLLAVADSAAQAQTEPEVEEEISTYRALAPVTVPARSSSMVPLMRRALPGQAFTMVTGSGTARTCVHVRNETGLVLQEGVGSFYVLGRFRGQTTVPRTEPGDIRVLCFGEDADVLADRDAHIEETVKLAEWRSNSLRAHKLRETALTWHLDNRAGAPRQVAIQVTHMHNGRILEPGDTLAGEGTERYLVVEVPARSKLDVPVRLLEGVVENVHLERPYVERMLERHSLAPEVVAILQRAMVLMQQSEGLSGRIAEERTEADRLQARVTRRQQSLKALPEAVAASRTAEGLLAEVLELQRQLERRIQQREAYEEQFSAKLEEVRSVLGELPAPPAEKTETTR